MISVIIQALVAFATFVFLSIGISLFANSTNNNKRHMVFIATSIFFFALSALAIGYFICDIFIFNFITLELAWLKMFLLALAIGLYFLLVFGSGSGPRRFYGGYTLLFMLLAIFMSTLLISTFEYSAIKRNQTLEYNQKVVVQESQTLTVKYPLISLKDTVKIEGAYDSNLTASASANIFAMRGSITSSENGELKTTDVYKLYYLADSQTGKILFTTLDVKNTPIYYIKDGEEPCIVKTSTKNFSIDYNLEPPQECNVKITNTIYELHLPKGSILEVFEIDME